LQKLIINALPPLSSCKNLPPYFFHGAFAPSFIWRRRPWSVKREKGVIILSGRGGSQLNGGESQSPLEHSNSGKKSFDSIRFGNLINLPLVH